MDSTSTLPSTHPFIRSEHHAGCAECGQTPVAAVHDWLAAITPEEMVMLDTLPTSVQGGRR